VDEDGVFRVRDHSPTSCRHGHLPHDDGEHLCFRGHRPNETAGEVQGHPDTNSTRGDTFEGVGAASTEELRRHDHRCEAHRERCSPTQRFPPYQRVFVGSEESEFASQMVNKVGHLFTRIHNCHQVGTADSHNSNAEIQDAARHSSALPIRGCSIESSSSWIEMISLECSFPWVKTTIFPNSRRSGGSVAFLEDEYRCRHTPIKVRGASACARSTNVPSPAKVLLLDDERSHDHELRRSAFEL
jgi:hypothetical protein